MKLQLNLIAKILTATLLFSGFKYIDIYKELDGKIKKTTSDISTAEVDYAKLEKKLAFARSLKEAGHGENINISVPVIVNEIHKEMNFYNVTGQIMPDANGVNINVYDVPLSNGKVKYIRLNMKGSFRDYASFKIFLNNLLKSNVSINKLAIVEKMNFDLSFDVIGKFE